MSDLTECAVALVILATNCLSIAIGIGLANQRPVDPVQQAPRGVPRARALYVNPPTPTISSVPACWRRKK